MLHIRTNCILEGVRDLRPCLFCLFRGGFQNSGKPAYIILARSLKCLTLSFCQAMLIFVLCWAGGRLGWSEKLRVRLTFHELELDNKFVKSSLYLIISGENMLCNVSLVVSGG